MAFKRYKRLAFPEQGRLMDLIVTPSSLLMIEWISSAEMEFEQKKSEIITEVFFMFL
jgi:hypothetical protein